MKNSKIAKDEAIERLEQALDIVKKQRGRNSMAVSHILDCMGERLLEDGRIEEAENCIRASLDIAESEVNDHLDQVINHLVDVAVAYSNSGNYQYAQEAFSRAKRSYKAYLRSSYSYQYSDTFTRISKTEKDLKMTIADINETA